MIALYNAERHFAPLFMPFPLICCLAEAAFFRFWPITMDYIVRHFDHISLRLHNYTLEGAMLKFTLFCSTHTLTDDLLFPNFSFYSSTHTNMSMHVKFVNWQFADGRT